MALTVGYDGRVSSNRATIAAFGSLVVLLGGATAAAQINAAPPSVTSVGFGGRAINGAPPSVTSLGPRGYTPGYNPAYPNSWTGFGTHHRHYRYFPLGAAVYAVPIYGYAGPPDDADNSAPDDQYNGGPTVFDRRGPGTAARASADSYAGGDDQAAALSPASAPSDPPPAPQPETVLVFKDGHQLEIGNYAIVGDTLYSLAGATRQKIALSDLDLDATVKANDNRGIDFEVPPGEM
jgi:hypothetical protein